MSTVVTLGLNVTTNATGATQRIVRPLLDQFTIQVIGTGTFSAAIQGSLDGTNWYALATKTADEIFTVSVVPYIRLVTSGMTGADVTVYAAV
jgi:hypothetical protein